VPYHTSYEVKNGPHISQTSRVHKFLTGREAGGIKPVFGLTACVSSSFLRGSSKFYFTCSAILIRAATIGYAREPDFEVRSPKELSMEERIAWALLNRKIFRDACEREGVDLRSAEKIVKRFERRLTRKEQTRMMSKL
jgi:peroxisomal coenzyme A diphosphatase NUDT7